MQSNDEMLCNDVEIEGGLLPISFSQGPGLIGQSHFFPASVLGAHTTSVFESSKVATPVVVDARSDTTLPRLLA